MEIIIIIYCTPGIFMLILFTNMTFFFAMSVAIPDSLTIVF